MAADPGDGAALLVHRNQQRNIGGRLIIPKLPAQGIRGLAVKVPVKQHQAAQMIVLNCLRRPRLRAAGQEELAYLLLRGHGRQPRLHRVGRLGGRRISGRYRRRRHGDRLSWHRLCFLFHGGHGRGSKLTGDQQQERCQSAQLQHQRKDQLSFHRISGSIPHWAIRRLSQLPRKYTIRNTAAAIAQLMG